MSIPPFKPPSVALSGPSVSSAAGIDSTSHAASSQQYNSSHPIHPLQQPPHQQQQHPQKQYLHLIHPQQNVSLTAPTSHQPQLSQAIQNCPPPPQQQHHPQHQQHQKVQSTHPRRGSVDRGTIKDPFKLKSSSISKAASEYVGPYLLGKTLGKGSSGCVKLARHRKTNEQAAVKIISKASLVNRAAVHRGIEREIAIMKLINHPHVIRLYDVYETEKELFLVMEYVSGGELFEYLVNKGRLDETEALRFFQQIIVGLAFCHKRKICHRDLKPENLLLDDRMNVKIADFGMASLQKSGRLLETSCGSPHYASPEVVTGMKYDGSSSDIWSCGIILYALLTGHLPFDDENIRQLLSKVKAGKFYMPTDISAGARDLISRMLTVNPKRRITMQGVMMHPWFRMVNPERNTLGEPAQDPESGRSIQVEELDAEILLHMRWLFAPGPSHSNPEAKEVFDEEALLVEIQEKMTSNEENMEKLFYHLLCQHKAELLENYIEDGSDIMPGNYWSMKAFRKTLSERYNGTNPTNIDVRHRCTETESRLVPKLSNVQYPIENARVWSLASVAS
ncbi:kinase-like domain-containing protein [Dissophora ornata]|nr:kinase-like domain-containing protein [Dissophora ornata]